VTEGHVPGVIMGWEGRGIVGAGAGAGIAGVGIGFMPSR